MKGLMVILILIIVIVILVDFIPLFTTWLSRIHIGKYSDKNQWIDRVAERSNKWLIKTPKVKVTDNTRLVIIDILKKNYTKSAIQYWQEAALLMGLNEYKKVNSSNEIENNINKFLKSKFDNNGEWIDKPKNVDCAILSYSVMKLDNSKKYKKAFDYTFELIKEHLGEDGTVKYTKNDPNNRYVDTIGFICPFLVRYGVLFENEESIELAINQIFQYEKFGVDDNMIPFHAYDINNKYKLGLCGWGRGLGWFAIGLIDSWLELPNDNKYKNILTEIIIKYSKIIEKVQLDNGGFGWQVTNKGTRIDSSTTATLGYFMICASQIDEISKYCKCSYEKAINYLMSVTRRDGVVDFSQGDTKAIGVYSMLFDQLPFTQGFTLRMMSLKLNMGGLRNEKNSYKENVGIFME